mgnify:CR=1 FL=1
MALRITQYDEPILRQSGMDVTVFDDKLAKLAEDMIDTMHGAEGIGLAAQQVGKAIRFCVVETPHNPEYPITCIFDGKPLNPDLLMPLALANPEIEELPGDDMVYEEGCLSFPDIRGDIVRAARETDHLAGILFIDRMEPEVLAEIKPDVKELKRLTKKALKKEGK